MFVFEGICQTLYLFLQFQFEVLIDLSQAEIDEFASSSFRVVEKVPRFYIPMIYS